MRSALLWLCLLAAPVLTFAQNNGSGVPDDASGSQPKAAQPTGRITGMVTCMDTHAPARGAIVIVQRMPSENDISPAGFTSGNALTASDGTYTIQNLPPGNYSVTAMLPGYLTEMQGELIAQLRQIANQDQPSSNADRETLRHPTVLVSAGQAAASDIRLERGAAISGHLRYPDGSPVSRAFVLIEEVAGEHPTANLSRMEQIMIQNAMSAFSGGPHQVDDRGAFRVFGLEPGKYRLSVMLPANERNMRDATQVSAAQTQMGYATPSGGTRFFAGDTASPAKARIFDLNRGDEIKDVDITLPLNPFHQVEGYVSTEVGASVGITMVTLKDTSDPALMWSGQIDESNHFLFSQVPAGTYELSVPGATTSRMITATDGRGQFVVYTHAFAPATMPVVVTSQDVHDLRLTLHEIPLTDQLKAINELNLKQPHKE